MKNYSSFMCLNFSLSQWYDMIWLQSLSHWVSAGFAYNHWPEGRESVSLRQHPISWLKSYVILYFLMENSESEQDNQVFSTWRSLLVTAMKVHTSDNLRFQTC